MNAVHVDWVVDSIPGTRSSASYSLPHTKHLANGLVLTNLHPSVSSSKNWCRSAWVSQSVKCPTSAQVMISLISGFEPHIGFCADSSEPALDSVSPSLSAPPQPTPLCVSTIKINIKHFFKWCNNNKSLSQVYCENQMRQWMWHCSVTVKNIL